MTVTLDFIPFKLKMSDRIEIFLSLKLKRMQRCQTCQIQATTVSNAYCTLYKYNRSEQQCKARTHKNQRKSNNQRTKW